MCMIFRIREVRYYTFISTMYYAMQACEKTGTEMIVLDRQNPLGGKVEGNLLKKGWGKFCRDLARLHALRADGRRTGRE